MLKKVFFSSARIALGIAIFFAPFMASCAKHVSHPGTANAFDSDAYDTLLVAHSVIETTKTDLVNGSFPAGIAGNVARALSGLVRGYNVLEQIYCGNQVQGPQGGLQCAPDSYHSAAMAGTATSGQSAAVQNAVSDVNTALTAVSTAKGAKP
jgi:hypothetical protein